MFSSAQEKTSKTFVISKRLPLFSEAFWEDRLPEGKKYLMENISKFAPKFSYALGDCVRNSHENSAGRAGRSGLVAEVLRVRRKSSSLCLLL